MGYTVYILQSDADGRYYVGQTSALEERLGRHNAGRERTTKNGAPWRVVYREEFEDRSKAVIREQEIKRKKSRQFIDRLRRSSRGVAQPG